MRAAPSRSSTHEVARAPLFVMGYPRSGTTLLADILDRNPDVTLANEPEIAFALHRQAFTTRSQIDGASLADLARRCSELRPFRAHLKRFSGREHERLERAAGPMGFAEVYEALLPRRQGVRVWGEKSLNGIFYADELLTAFPHAFVVLIVRDPRAVALSKAIKRRAKGDGFRRTSSYDAGAFEFRSSWGLFATEALRWSAWCDAADRFVRDPRFVGRHVLVRYEDLVASPHMVVARLCAAAGLPFVPTMVERPGAVGSRIVHSAHYAHEGVGRPIDPSRARAFEALPASLLAVVERLAATGLAVHGYAPLSRRLGPLAWARVQLRLTLRGPRLRTDQRRWVGQRLRPVA